MEKRWIHFLMQVSIWIFFILSFLWLLRGLFLGYYPDFNGYYFGSKFFLTGKNPYLGGFDFHTTFVYPPTVILMFVPLTLFDFQSAEFLWAILNIVFLIYCFYLLSRLFKSPFFSSQNLILMSLVMISFPVKFTLGMGQINMLLLMLLAISYWLLVKKREFASGFFLGASFAVKLFPIILPVYFLLKLKKKVLLGFFSSLLISILLVLVFIPSGIYSDYLSVLSSLVSSWKLDYYNQSLSGFIGRSFGVEGFATVFKSLISIILVGITFFVVFKNKEKDFKTMSLILGTLITLNVAINTFSWQHHFIWLILPFYATFFYLKKLKAKKIFYFFLVLSYLLISVNLKNPSVFPVLVQSHVFYGALILLFLDLFLLMNFIQSNDRRIKKNP